MQTEPSHDPQSEFCEQDFYKSGRCLWLNVLKRAFEEARGINLITGLGSRVSAAKVREEQVRIQAEAREWLGDDSEGLEVVCEWAGVDVREVLKTWREGK